MPKFLIVRFSSIGDIVLTSPVIRCLKQQVAGSEIHYLTKQNFSPVIEHNAFIDKKIYLENDLSDTINILKNEKYDCLIDLHHNLRTWKIKRTLGIKSVSYNKLNIEKWLLVNLKINRLPRVHIVDRYLQTVRSLGVVNDGKGLDYFIAQHDALALQKLPAAFADGFIAFAIGANHNTKKLPVDKAIEACRQISKPVVILGGKEDFENGKAISTAISGSRIFNGCGLFTLNESAAIIKQSTRVISHDTGLMHIAAAFKKEIVSIWGNTVPEFGMYPYYGDFNVWNQRFEITLPCRPCSKIGYSKCPQGHFRCMREQDVAKIAEAAN